MGTNKIQNVARVRRRVWQAKVEEEGRLDNCFPPGSAILTICERLEAHLAAVFAKTSHGPSSHLHHIDGTRPQTLHTRCVCLASQDSGVDLSVVLEEEEEETRKFGSFGERQPTSNGEGVTLKHKTGGSHLHKFVENHFKALFGSCFKSNVRQKKERECIFGDTTAEWTDGFLKRDNRTCESSSDLKTQSEGFGQRL